MRRYLFLICGLLVSAFAQGQNTLTIGSGTTVKGSNGVQVVLPANLVNNGTYTIDSGTTNITTAGTFSGSGTGANYQTQNLTVNTSTGTTLFSSVVSVLKTATLTAGNVNANSDLTLAAGANLVNNGSVLTGNVQGLVTKSTQTSGTGTYTPTLSINASGTVMNYQWQSSPDNISWTNVATATSATYSPVVVANAYYRNLLTTSNSAFSEPTASILLNFTPSSTINESGTTTAFTSCAGTASAAQAFSVSGTTLVDPITATAPTGYEVSSASASSGFGPTASIPQTGGTASGTIWVRLTASASGTPSNNVVLSTTGASSVNVAVSGTVTTITANTSQINVICFGTTSGSISILAPGGGAFPYSYAWTPNVSTTSSASNLGAGSYSVVISDANSCSITKNFTITQPPALVASASAQTNVSCFNGNNGAATVSATGGTGAYTYSWSPSGGTAAMASGLSAGTYTVTVTDANTCTATQLFTITQPASALSATPASQTNVACFGGNTGNATVSATGGTGAYTYSWAPSGGTAATASGLAAGTYTVTVTDANSCTATQSFTITQPASALAATAVSQTNVACFGTNTGSAVVGAGGGTSPYTYSWTSGGGTAAKDSNLIAGTYTVTVTDANACTATKGFTITQPGSAVTTTAVSQTNVSCNGGSNGNATVSATGGTGAYTYSWSPSGGTAATASGLSAGTYTVTVTDANLCTATRSFIITQPAAVTAGISGTTTICTGSSATISLNSNTPGAAISYTTNGSGSTTVTMDGGGNATFSTGPLSASTTYALTTVANGGCTYTASGSAVVTVNPTPTVNSVSDQTVCYNSLTTAVTFTGTPSGVTYNWTNNNTAIGLAASASGVSGIPAFTATNTTTGRITGTVTVTPVYSNGASCSGTSTVFHYTVEPQLLLTSATGTQTAVCSGTTFHYTPSSNVSSLSPTFTWARNAVTGLNNGASASGSGDPAEQLINNNANGVVTAVYTYTVTMDGCTSPAYTISVPVNATPVLSSSHTAGPICNNAILSYTPTSNTTSTVFNFRRNTAAGIGNAGSIGIGNPNETLNDTTAGQATATYIYTLQAPDGCLDTENVVVTVNPTPKLTSPLSAGSQCNNGTFAYTAQSSTTGATFSWMRSSIATINGGVSGSGTGNVSEVLSNSGTAPVTVHYTYMVIYNGCTNPSSYDVTIIVNPTPVLSTGTAATICSGTNFSYTPGSATSGATYSWTRAVNAFINGGVGATGTGSSISETLANGTASIATADYTYTITANGCINTQHVLVTVNPSPVLNSGLNPSAICSGSTFSYTPGSATANTSYSWVRASVAGITAGSNTGSGTGGISTTLTSTNTSITAVNYVYTLTANGCQNSQTVSVNVNPTPVVNTDLSTVSQCSGTTFAYTAGSATSGATFSWTRATVAGINGGNSSTGTGNISEVLTNSTTAQLSAVYSYVVSANGCTNSTSFTKTVVVNPTPVLSSGLTPAAICNGAAFSYTPGSATAGATFSWTRAAVAGVTVDGNAGSFAGTGSAINASTIINNNTAVAAVVYAYTTTANGCGNTQNVSVNVNPTPVLSSGSAATICSGTAVNYTAASTTGGATFSWIRAAVTGISVGGNSGSASGTGNITEVLMNNTASPVQVAYSYTVSINGCANATSYPVTVTVNPGPGLSNTTSGSQTCNGSVFAYTPASGTTGTTFSWTRAGITGINGGAGATGTGSAISETLSNTNNNPTLVTYTYTLTANGCSSTPTVSTTVNPTPVLTSPATATTCSGSAVGYTAQSQSTGATFSWTRAAITGITVGGSSASGSGTGNITEVLNNTTAAAIQVSYTYKVSVNGCQNSTGYPVTVTVNPGPALSSSLTPAAVCSGSSFSYTPTSGTAGATFSWTRAAVAGVTVDGNSGSVAGTGSAISGSILVNANTAISPVVYVYTISANGCSSNQNVTVNVNPTPVLSNATLNYSSCNNTKFSFVPASATAGTTYSWSRAAVSGITVGTASGSATGNGSSGETLVNGNTTPTVVTYLFTPTANTCIGTQATVVDTVYPNPQFISTLTPAATCSGSTFAYTAQSSTPNATFSWSRAAVANVNGSGTGSGTGNISEVLTNSGTTVATVKYVYTTSIGACAGSPTAMVTVSLNPQPALSGTIPATACSNIPFVYNEQSTVTGTTYSWGRASVTGVSAGGSSASGSGTGAINETLLNTGTTAITINYAITLTANGCSYIQTIPIVVNPLPLFSGAATATVCAGTALNYAPASNLSGATYSWTRVSVAGINNSASGSGTGNITETLSSTNTTATTVNYVYTTTANGCANPVTSPVAVTVNPLPVLSNPSTTLTSCSGSSFMFVPTSNVSGGATFKWNRAVAAGISNGSASGSSTAGINETLVNNTGTGAIATATYVYTLTPVSGTGCVNTQNVTVNVYPPSTLNSTTSPAAVCSGNPFLYTPTSVVAGTTYTWTRAAVTGVTAAGSSAGSVGSGGINELLASTLTAPVTVSYVYTVTANNCPGTPTTVNVTVNPNPVLSNTPTSFTLCNATPFTFTPASATTGTTYTWSRAAVTGLSAGTNGGSASGSNGLSTTFSNGTNTAQTATFIYTLLANGCTNNQNVSVTVNPDPQLSSAMGLQSTAVCSGGVFSYVPASNVAGATYSWSRVAIAGINGGISASGTGGINETMTNTTGATKFVRYVYLISANGCTSPTADTVIAKVRALPQITADVHDTTICAGLTTTFGVTANGSGLLYQWQLNTGNGIWGNINDGFPYFGTSTATLTATGYTTTMNGYQYRVLVSGDCNPMVTSATGTLHINTSPAVSNQPVSTSVCEGGSTTFAVTASGAGLIYQWQADNGSGYLDLTDGSTLSGSQSNTLTILDAQQSQSGQYRIVINGTCSPGTISSSASLTVNPAPTAAIASIGNNTSFCAGGSITLYANTGANLSYQWYLNNVPVTSNGSSSTYVASDSGAYTVLVSSVGTACSTMSQPLVVNSYAIPVSTIRSASSDTLCPGTTVKLTANVTAGNAAVYQWYLNGVIIPNAMNGSYIAGAAGNYSVKVSNPAGCSGYSDTVAVVLRFSPQITASGITTICSGDSVTLTAGSGTGLGYQWRNGNNIIIGATDQSYVVTSSGSYSVYLVGGGCGTELSNTISVTVNTTPQATIGNGSDVICGSGTITLTANGSSASGISYQWYKDGLALSNTPSSSLLVSDSGNYSVLETNANGCSNMSAVRSISQSPLPDVTIVGNGNTMCVTNVAGNSYQWYEDGNILGNGISACYSFTEDGVYTVEVHNAAGCSDSSYRYLVSGGKGTGVSTVSGMKVQIYPNPTTGLLYVDAPVTIGLRLQSLDGRELRYEVNSRSIDLGGLANGIYILQVYDAAGQLITTQRISKDGQ